jgi:hypothetical protein
VDKSAQSVLILAVISVVVALAVHFRVRDYVKASLISAALTSLLFQVVIYFDVGHIDPFVLISLVTGFVAALVVSMVVGLLFRKRNAAGVARRR